MRRRDVPDGIACEVTPEQFVVEFTARELRGAEAGEFALVFVGEDGRVEVGVLAV